VVTSPDPAFPAPTGRVWRGGAASATFNSGVADNDVSIGLMVRFNQFLYFTAGDLPVQGENLLWPALLADALPTGTAGGLLAPPAPPPPMVGFKCGHHGASTSTSPTMLTGLLPMTAIISCGAKNSHPDQSVITLLQGQPSVSRILLTNCRYHRVGVPASPAVDRGLPPAAPAGGVGPGAIVQAVAGNKSRVSGDNVDDNLAPGRSRGDIQLSVTEAGSTAAAGARSYTRTYFENYPPAGVPVGPNILLHIW
jgi:hypothetical protein